MSKPGSTARTFATSGSLPERVFERLVTHSEFGGFISVNPHLPLNSWKTLYRNATTAQKAIRLLRRPLTQAHVEFVLDTASERRPTVLRTLLDYATLTEAQYAGLVSDTMSSAVATALLDSASVPWNVKMDVIWHTPARTQLVWLSVVLSPYGENVPEKNGRPVGLTDSVLWKLLAPAVCAIDMEHGHDIAFQRAVYILGKRPKLAEKAARHGDCRLAAASMYADANEAARLSALGVLYDEGSDGWSASLVNDAILTMLAWPSTTKPALDEAHRIASERELACVYATKRYVAVRRATRRDQADSKDPAVVRMIPHTLELAYMKRCRQTRTSNTTRPRRPALVNARTLTIVAGQKVQPSSGGSFAHEAERIVRISAYLTSELGDDPDSWALVLALADMFNGTWQQLIETAKAAVYDH